MHNVRKVTEDLYWVGGDDHRLTSYLKIYTQFLVEFHITHILLLDKKTVLFDTVDWSIGRQFLENIRTCFRMVDILIIW